MRPSLAHSRGRFAQRYRTFILFIAAQNHKIIHNAIDIFPEYYPSQRSLWKETTVGPGSRVIWEEKS